MFNMRQGMRKVWPELSCCYDVCVMYFQKLSLCQDLYGLHFQLLQLFEGYMKLVQRLTEKTQQVCTTWKDY